MQLHRPSDEQLRAFFPHPWCRPSDLWDTLTAARDGDLARIDALLSAEPRLANCEFWYTRPLHFATREGHARVAQRLLAAGADPFHVRHRGADLVDLARERGHESLAASLEDARAQRPAEAERFTPLDLALWRRNGWRHGEEDAAEAREALVAAAPVPLTIAAALGDEERVAELLAGDPGLVHEQRPWGFRPLSAAAQGGHAAIVERLLAAGADPCAEEGNDAPRGSALWWAARGGHAAIAEKLLAAGADPDAGIESGGSATWIAGAGSELRALLVRHGGRLDAWSLAYEGSADEVLALADADPEGVASAGCGGIYAAVVTNGRRDLMAQLLARGVRCPRVLTGCLSYLWEDLDMFRTLLAQGGIRADLHDWQGVTLLHELSDASARVDSDEARFARMQLLLDAGADLEARDEEYRSTPLGWAARTGAVAAVRWLVERGADES